MSEKIYAYLLLLLPSAFRRHYEEEALRLLRDRLRDERGICRRLRLSWDLLTDMIRALPLAYRNSYAEITPAASFAADFEGVPSFQILEREPIRRETIISACILSLTALAALTYVIQLPAPHQTVERNGRISPIVAVLERYHESTEDVSRSDGSDNSTFASTGASQPRSAAGADSQSAPLARSIAEASQFDHRVAAAVPAPSSPASVGRPTVQRRPDAILVPRSDGSPFYIPSNALVRAEPSSAASVSGQALQSRLGGTGVTALSISHSNAQTPGAGAVHLSGDWDLRATEGDAGVPRRFIFWQDGAELRGTGGRGSTEQYPIIHGSVAGDSVKFELKNRKVRFLYDLRLEEGVLRGTLSIKNANNVRVTEVWLDRVWQH